MSWSSYAVLTLLLIVQSVVGMFGGHFGYTVNGVPQGGTPSSDAPGLLGVVEWIWDSIAFMFHMLTFGIDGMPEFVSMMFVIMATLTLFLILKLIRSGGD